MLRIALVLIVALMGAAQAKTAKVVLAGGCFWCVEANFESLTGVKGVVSGFTGGNSRNPTYEAHDGHYEAVEVTYDDARLSFTDLIDKFLHSTDVVDAGGQFCDRGTAYASAIFVSNAAEKAIVVAEIAKAQAALGQKVVTRILPGAAFWRAEDYHQDYYKGTAIVLTRAGPKLQSGAYAFYRDACGRDQRLKALWGDQAAFLH